MNGNPKPDIRALSITEIENFFKINKQDRFRAKQLFEWLWKKNCRSFGAMTNLPAGLRSLLESSFNFPVANPVSEQVSHDGTIKVLFSLHDDLKVEGVLIPSSGRTTACISSQAGCALECKFCATGQLGFMRNLSAGEIFDQVMTLDQMSVARHENHLSNIVFMGMGEPLMNYDNVLLSIERLTSTEGMGISPQRITVSSVGIPKLIRQLADDGAKFHFALSLHAATNEKRNSIIPLNRHHPVEKLTEALKYYHAKSGKRFTIEYILFRDFNDGISDAKDLALFCKSFPVKINLIEYNPVDNTGMGKPDPDKVKKFAAFLESKNLVVNIRKSRGEDIDAACGQLAGKSQKNENKLN
jgi:23S rRNA (adenine2503-C2)-methyltransferase